MTGLKPCPFCGGEAEIEQIGTRRQSMIIACTNCGCRHESGDVLCLTENERMQWNTRRKSEAEELLEWLHEQRGSLDCVGTEQCVVDLPFLDYEVEDLTPVDALLAAREASDE